VVLSAIKRLSTRVGVKGSPQDQRKTEIDGCKKCTFVFVFVEKKLFVVSMYHRGGFDSRIESPLLKKIAYASMLQIKAPTPMQMISLLLYYKD